MRPRHLFRLLLLMSVASLGVLACSLSTLGLLPQAKPTVTILAPIEGTPFREGDDISVQSISTDSTGIVRVELAVDGSTVRTDPPPIPQGQTSFTLVQIWRATAGQHTISVRAYNTSGAASEPVLVNISVGPAITGGPSTEPGTPTTVAGLPLVLTPTLGPTLTSAATATRRPPTQTPAPTAITAPPNVYAASIRVDPVAPKRGQYVKFWVTFINNTTATQTYRWRIRMFEPDKRNSFGDTAIVTNDIPMGKIEFASSDNWRVTGAGDCMQFTARVFWIDPDSNQENEFLKPDLTGGPAAGFQVCP